MLEAARWNCILHTNAMSLAQWRVVKQSGAAMCNELLSICKGKDRPDSPKIGPTLSAHAGARGPHTTNTSFYLILLARKWVFMAGLSFVAEV